MRIFTVILLTINLVTIGWLFVGAKIDLPSWEKPFQEARSALDDLERQELKERIAIAALRSHLNEAESSTKFVIDEYRRSELPLLGLALGNIVVLFVLALKGKRTKFRQ